MARIGSHFSDELKAAGLLGLPFSWGLDGTVTFDPRMTQGQKDAVLAVLAAHNPNPPLFPVDSLGNPTAGAEPVWNADRVDEVTAKRIAKLITPWEGRSDRMTLQAMLRQVEGAMDAISTIAIYAREKADGVATPTVTPQERDAALLRIQSLRTLRNQIVQIRQEAADFKASKGW